MKRRPSLTDEEVEQAIDKIRRLYDDYIITFTKPFRLKNLFEDRYFEARKRRIDLTGFVYAELAMVQSLKTREEEKIAEAEERHFKRLSRRTRGDARGLAERVMEEHRKRIEKYPDLEVDARASFEITKLFGALDKMEKELWPPFERVLRKIYPTYFSNPRIELEPRFYALTCGAGGSPPITSRYKALLLRLPRSANDVEWEEKRLVLEAAFLFHHLLGVIEELYRSAREELEEEDLNAVENIRHYVVAAIADFRLADLKPSNLGG